MKTMEKERLFLGAVGTEGTRNADGFIGEHIAVFMPVSGPCGFAVSAMHAHPSYQFVLAFNDRVTFRIDDKEVLTDPGRLLAISPGVAHMEIPADRFPRYIALFIEKDFFESIAAMYPEGGRMVFSGEYIPLPGNFLNTVREFMLEAEQKLPGGDSLLSALSIRICHLILRSRLDLVHKVGRLTRRIEIDRTIEYMNSNLGKKISVEQLAEIANMSPSHYIRTFKKETGQSSIAYLNLLRLDRVKRLLMEGERTIAEIALDCGFGSPAYLSSSFFKKFRLTPRDYQNLLKAEGRRSVLQQEGERL